MLTLVAVRADAQDRRQEIRSMLESRDAEIKRLLGRDDASVTPAQKERLRTVINDVIDFRAMGRAALGTHWAGLSTAQQDDFVAVFTDIVRGQSLANLDPYRARVQYDGITVNGNTAHVVTSTVYKDVPMKVEYDLVFAGGSWRATDIVLDNVSTVEGYSRSFQSMVRKRGFEALMERLRKKQAAAAD
jgi:phospholipid transport system substrate-binding protein